MTIIDNGHFPKITAVYDDEFIIEPAICLSRDGLGRHGKEQIAVTREAARKLGAKLVHFAETGESIENPPAYVSYRSIFDRFLALAEEAREMARKAEFRNEACTETWKEISGGWYRAKDLIEQMMNAEAGQ